MNKIQKIKEIVQKIDIGKIAEYSEKHPKSKTLKEIVKYSKKTWESDNEQKILKLAVKIAYNLDTICDAEKTGYVRNKEEKKYWLEISEELFENSIGIENKK